MKKSVIFIAAALALVGCAKTQDVNTSGPKEMSFKAITNVVTRADNQLEGALLDNTYSIYASATQRNSKGVIENTAYFTDTEFTTADNPVTAASEYKANPTIYWPIGGGSVDFLAYACPTAAHATLAANWANAASDVATTVAFANWDTYQNQIDLLYAAANAQNTTDNAGAGNSVHFTFNHAQALLVFKAKVNTPDVITLNSITLPGLKVVGDFTVDNSRNMLQAKWSNLAAVATKDVIPAGVIAADDYLGEALDAAAVADYVQVGSTLLVPEQPRLNFTLNYTIGANTMEFTYNDLRGNWEKGKKYIYQLDITLNQIIVTEDVVPYDEITATQPLS